MLSLVGKKKSPGVQALLIPLPVVQLPVAIKFLVLLLFLHYLKLSTDYSW